VEKKAKRKNKIMADNSFKIDYKKNPMKMVIHGGCAWGGGVAAELVADFANSKAPEWVANNPKLAEGIPAAAGTALLYFTSGTKLQEYAVPAAFGMFGAVGAGMADDIVQLSGFSRNNRGMNGSEADNYKKGLDYIEKLQKQGFEGSVQGYNGGQMNKGWG
jgi:hypothetical protein